MKKVAKSGTWKRFALVFPFQSKFLEDLPVDAVHTGCLSRQWRRQDLVPGGAHAKVTGLLQ